MSALAVDSVTQIRVGLAASTEVRRESRIRDTLLDHVRTDTYRSANLVRDYLLETDDTRAGPQKAELEALRAQIRKTLAEYAAKAPSPEAAAIRSLEERTEAYWKSVAPAMEWGGEARRTRGPAFLKSVIVPGRDDLVQLERQIGTLDEEMLDANEGRIEIVQNRFRRQVTTISIVALLLGSVLATVVFGHVRRLDAEAARRYDEVCQARQDLKRLTDRLVKVQEQERRNLSHELHDDLGQTMSAMLMDLTEAERMPAGSPDRREALASVRRLAEENVAKIRNMALLLRPAMLDELGLVSAIRWLAREVARRTGLSVRVVADEVGDDLPDPERTCIYRIVQEALNNCVKHSKASEVRVVLRHEGEYLSVCVQDNGVGFDPEREKGVGLLGMMERVTALGGRFHVESHPGRGTTVSTGFLLRHDARKTEEGMKLDPDHSGR